MIVYENVNLFESMYKIIKERVYPFNYEQIEGLIKKSTIEQFYLGYLFLIKSVKYVNPLLESFKEQGVSKGVAMNVILNYYHAKSLESRIYRDIYVDHYQIFPKTRIKKVKV